MGNSPTQGRRIVPGVRPRPDFGECNNTYSEHQQHRLHLPVVSTAQTATADQPVAGDREDDRHRSVADRLTHSILSDLVDEVTGDVVTSYRSKATTGLQVAAGKPLESDRDDTPAATPDGGTPSPMLTSPETNSSESSSSPSDDDDWKPGGLVFDGRRQNIPALVLSDGEEEEDAGPGRKQSPSPDLGRSSTASPPETPAYPPLTVEHLRGMIADMPSRTSVLVQQAVHHFWQARSSAALGSRELALLQASEEPPVQFSADYCEDEDLDIEVQSLPNICFVSRSLIFDVIAEFVGKIYAGEDAEAEQQQRSSSFSPTDPMAPTGSESGTAAAGHQQGGCCRLTSAQFRLWQGPTRPMTVDRLLELVREHVRKELPLRHTDTKGTTEVLGSNTTLATGSALSRLAQWTLSRKSYVDRILELELRADEGSWLSYVPEENRLKALLADQLWQELVDDAVASVLAAAARRPVDAAGLVVR